MFIRNWDSSCPRVWEEWESNGQKWVIQDLDPRDDEEALKILQEHLVPDEELCAINNLSEDETSFLSMSEFWRVCISQRMTLALYTWVDGEKTLVALNACMVISTGDKFPDVQVEGKAWIAVHDSMNYLKEKCNPHEYLQLDTVLHAGGLVVKREYRGQRLGAKLLAAREPLCKFHGIKGSSSVFSVPAAQKSAASCGFVSIAEATWKELAEAGLQFPQDTKKIIKLMVRRYE